MKNLLNKSKLGLTGLVLASAPLMKNCSPQQEIPYMANNVHDVKYELTDEKEFPAYKLEEQFLFNNWYTFWGYTPKANELNFWISNKDEETFVHEIGNNTSVNAPKYVPVKVADKIDVTNIRLSRTSYEKLKSRAKSQQYFGFSVDITSDDLKFDFPEIDVNGTSYIVLDELVDVTKEKNLPLYLIPKTSGTKINIPTQTWTDKNGYNIQATIVCNKNGGVYSPILKEDKSSNTSSGNFPSGSLEKKTETAKDSTNLVQKTTTKKEKTPCTYVVQPKDTYWSIAEDKLLTGKRAGEIKALNSELDETKLPVNKEIEIPCE